MKKKIINLKCIDDYNNYLSLILESNINGLLKVLNIDYQLEIPESNFFKDSENENIILENDDNIEIEKPQKLYNDCEIFNPYD